MFDKIKGFIKDNILCGKKRPREGNQNHHLTDLIINIKRRRLSSDNISEVNPNRPLLNFISRAFPKDNIELKSLDPSKSQNFINLIILDEETDKNCPVIRREFATISPEKKDKEFNDDEKYMIGHLNDFFSNKMDPANFPLIEKDHFKLFIEYSFHLILVT